LGVERKRFGIKNESVRNESKLLAAAAASVQCFALFHSLSSSRLKAFFSFVTFSIYFFAFFLMENKRIKGRNF
jgi:hypothetical protein